MASTSDQEEIASDLFDEVTRLQEEVYQLTADAKRYKYIKDNYMWRRYPDDGFSEAYALLGCKFPYSIDFSSGGMVDYAIDKAMEKKDDRSST